jgi:hypothetical protein
MPKLNRKATKSERVFEVVYIFLKSLGDQLLGVAVIDLPVGAGSGFGVLVVCS